MKDTPGGESGGSRETEGYTLQRGGALFGERRPNPAWTNGNPTEKKA